MTDVATGADVATALDTAVVDNAVVDLSGARVMTAVFVAPEMVVICEYMSNFQQAIIL